MSTIFIALQCYQCSTMQVKQKKKISNKWNCVVCNEKQSVRKVFAQGSMAKDVRKFVQSFNMSRQIADQQFSNHETLIPQAEEIENQFESDMKKKRTDWSEYLDPEEHEEGPNYSENEADSGDDYEKKFVTELPKVMFKKPKLKNESVGSNTEDSKKLYRPEFSQRNANKHIKPPVFEDSSSSSDDDLEMLATIFIILKYEERKRSRNRSIKGAEKSKCWGAMAKTTSKSGDITKKVDGSTMADKETIRHPLCAAAGSSKWSEYINEDDEFAEKNDGDVNNVEFEVTLNDEKVEDDIHPDFK